MVGAVAAGNPTLLSTRRWKGEQSSSSSSPSLSSLIRHQCTYCGGDVEDTFSTAGILAACFLFPIGELPVNRTTSLSLLLALPQRDQNHGPKCASIHPSIHPCTSCLLMIYPIRIEIYSNLCWAGIGVCFFLKQVRCVVCTREVI